MATEIDSLVVRVDADLKGLDAGLSAAQKDLARLTESGTDRFDVLQANMAASLTALSRQAAAMFEALDGGAAGFADAMTEAAERGRESTREMSEDAKRKVEDLGSAGEAAFDGMESLLAKFFRTGELGFEDFKSVALDALETVAQTILDDLQGAIEGVFSIGGPDRGIFGGIFDGLFSGFGGARANGGPVAPGQPYLVGERGPELMVPSSAGTVVPPQAVSTDTAPRRLPPIVVNVHGVRDGDALRRSGSQVARQVRRALLQAEGGA